MELKKYKIGDLVQVTRGASLGGEFYATQGNYVRLTCGNFDYRNNCFKENQSKDNIYYTGGFKEDFILEKGDIITPLTEQAIGLLGSTARIPESGKYIQSQDIAKIDCNESLLDKDFAFYLISSACVKQQLSAAAQQTKIRHTSPDKIKECTVWIPSLDIQKRIGRILTDIDNKIAINRQINDNLEAMAKQLYDYWFVQFDFPNEEGKPYKSSGGAMVWNEKLKREIPQGWDNSMLQSICTIKRGASPRPIDDFMDESHKGMPWVKISDATNSNSPFMTNIKEHIILDGVPKSVKVIPNTLIVSNSATPGIPKFIQIEACVHDGWLVLTDYQEIYKYYLYYVIKMIRHNLLHIASGSIFKNLKTDYLKEFICITPSTEILSKYHNLVKPIMQEILLLQRDTEVLTKQRDELLPLLMNGQASVNYHLSVHFFLPLYYIETNTILWHERNNYTSRFRRYASGSD